MALDIKDRMNAVAGLGKQPWVRILAVGGVALIGGSVALYMTSGSGGDSSQSTVPSAPRLGQNSAGIGGSEDYNRAVHENNAARAASADAHFGESAIATPVLAPNKPSQDSSRPESTREAFFGKKDTAEEKPAEQPQQQTTHPAPAQAAAAKTDQPAIDKIQDLMQKRMAEMDKRYADRYGAPASVELAVATSAGATAATAAKAETTTTKKVRILERAGTTEYGINLIEASTDDPASPPVEVKVMSGPFAKESDSCVGKGAYTSSEQGMVVQIKQIDCDAKSYPVDAYLVTKDGKFSIEDDVDHHYLERIVLPAAAAFLQGYGQAASQQQTQLQYNAAGTVQTLAVSPLNPTQEMWKAGGAVGTSLGNTFQKQADGLKTTRTLFANSPVGILFVSNVEEDL